MLRGRSRWLLLALAVLVARQADDARADWPMARHDARRTGQASGISGIQKPERIWRYYLGGALAPDALVVLDLDPSGGDGAPEYVMARGGGLVAKRLDDSEVWSAAPRDLHAILAARDLDGDGRVEIVAAGSRHVVIFDAASGEVRWTTPTGLMQQYGSARIGDLDGDGLDEIVLVEAGPCAANPGIWPGAVFSFRDGVESPVQLWQLPHLTCSHGKSLTLFDADGDGTLEVLLGTEHSYHVLDGATGVERARSSELGSGVQHAGCVPFRLGAGTAEALACVRNEAFYWSERSIYVLAVQGQEVELWWKRPLAAAPGGEVETTTLVEDLGGGARVIAGARPSSTEPWTTYVYGAETGGLVGMLVGERYAGIADSAAGGMYLLTTSPAGLRAWREAGGEIVLAWTRPGDDQPLVRHDPSTARRSLLARRTAVTPLRRRLLVRPVSEPGVVRALAIDDDGASLAAELRLPPGVQVNTTFTHEPLAAHALAVTRSDGYLVPLDEALVPQLGADDVHRLGLTTGGYYAAGGFRELSGTPRTGDLDGSGRDAVVVTNSQGSTVRLDAADAALHAAPRPAWTLAFKAPTIVRAGGEVRIAGLTEHKSATGTTYGVVLVDADGGPIWDAELPGPPLSDVIGGSLDEVDGTDFVVQWGAPGDVLLRTRALRGSDGNLLWEDITDPGAGRAPAGPAIAPWPGSPRDVVLHVAASRVLVLAGGTGAVVAQSAPLGIYYGMPTAVNLDEDPELELVITGGFWPVRVLDDDLEPLWTSPGQDRPFPYGAVARCADGSSVVVSLSRASPSRIAFTRFVDGAVHSVETRWLAESRMFLSEEELIQHGAWPGQLTSATVHGNLTGEGVPSALVGSSDGVLYVVAPCTGALQFAYGFSVAVGEAVFGDIDGDGRDEILVTTADGYLWALQNHTIDAPGWVADVDARFTAASDIDEVPPTEPLAARWPAVEGALGYQVAVVDELGAFQTTPAWFATSEPRVVIPISTAPGKRYRVLVRSIGPHGRSVDSASDGVRILAPTLPDADPDDELRETAGCCRSTHAGNIGVPILAFAVLLILRRRAHRVPEPADQRPRTA